MSVPVAKIKEIFTYGDYLTWPEDERWELIHGVAYNMSPAPSTEHQRVLRKLLVLFDNFFSDSKCEVFIAPFDVRLPEGGEKDEEILTVVQPDISIICDPSKIDEKGCKGAPELIIEILSPSSAKKDTKEKLTLYEKHGVQEYWVVHPYEHIIEIFSLNKQNTYGKPDMYAEDDVLPVSFFPGLEIDLALVFGIERKETEGT